MTPGVELAESIEQAEILVIVHARYVFGDRATRRQHAKSLRPCDCKGLDRIVDLQRPLTVPDQQAERCHTMFEQGMKHVRRARAVAEDRCAAARSWLLRGRCGKLPSDTCGLWGSRCKPGLDQCLAAEEIMQTERKPAAQSLEDDVSDAIARHDRQYRLFQRS